MSVSRDIVKSWRHPRRVVRGLLAQGVREDRALAFLMIGCGLIFVAQWPRLAREAEVGGEPLDMLIGTTLFAWLIVMPLVFYALAALAHLVARALGGRGGWFGARLALFWAVLAASPVLLLHGLVTGFIGAGVQANLVGAVWLAGFAAIWGAGLREAEAPGGAGVPA